MSVVPPYPAYPTEVVYTNQMHTDEAAVTVRESGKSRLVYFAGDLGRSYWRSGHPDILRLISNALAWTLRDAKPVRVEGDGFVELFAWDTEPGFAVHILNLNNPNLHRGVILEHSPIGPQKVVLQVPRKVSRVTALRTEREIPFTQSGATVEFTIPSVTDYEVAAIV
jgi:hypothetical protein